MLRNNLKNVPNASRAINTQSVPNASHAFPVFSFFAIVTNVLDERIIVIVGRRMGMNVVHQREP